jgi:hypothetical protein
MVRWCLRNKNQGAAWVINIVHTLNRRRASAELASPEPAICCITQDGACSKEAYFRGVSRLAHRTCENLAAGYRPAQLAVTEDLEERYALVDSAGNGVAQQ